ncbi:MAG: hypothetical protein IJ679_11195 [Lachnospiraceae bacterium]|nr:hypothetical protein [Lachnospiraceae bacterium]
METKKCKFCMTDIPKKAKVCPQCGRKQGGIVKWIVIGVIVLAVLGSIAGGGGDSSDDTSSVAKTSVAETSDRKDGGGKTDKAEKKEKKEEAAITYSDVSVETLMNDLESNAMAATDTYKGNYYAITGKLSNIDAQGSYISLTDPNADFAIIGVTCYIKTDEVREKIKTLSKGSVITVRGKMTNVGEVFGYYFDIDSID